ncbi:MAG: MaoC family dehydratase N-terminal domain-containing protein [Deltaproteobacteria bacterium]|nr:MaoC family dehydratase N-terminal domain-containing protein [Deltaproteobacteria bacterium]
MTELPDEAKRMIGVEKTKTYQVTKKDIRRYAQAIGDLNPLYFDEAYAAGTRYGKIVAPPLFCHSFAFDDVPAEELREDGLPIELDVPLPVTRAIGGGSVFDVGSPISPGDEIKVTKKIVDIYSKTGKSGLLYFIVIDTLYENQNNEMVAREKATYIQR